MSVTTNTTVNGQILSQSKDGVVSHFVSDPLGSVVMVRDNAGNTVYEAEYDPYGNVQSETGTNPSEFGFVGTLGYVKDSAFSLYVRARYLLTNLGRWLTKDPLWPSEPGFVYAGAAPSFWIDADGLACTNTALKGQLDCIYRRGPETKHAKKRSFAENRGCDKCKCPGPIICEATATLKTSAKGYNVAKLRVVSIEVSGACGAIGNLGISGFNTMLQSQFGDIIIGLIGGGSGGGRRGWYIDCAGTATFWVAMFQCGPEYCGNPRPSPNVGGGRRCPGDSLVFPKPFIMPGEQVRGGPNPIWN